MTWIAWLAPRLAGLWAVVILLWYAAIILVVNARGYDSWPSDFTVFWHAARLALAGDPTAAFNQASMADVWRFPDGTDLRADWLYPPTWLLLLLPFGALPFTPALILYGTCSVLALWLATRPAASTLPGGVFLVLASPAVPLGVHLSNTTLMMAAILAAALLFLSRDRPLLTSAAIAGFAIKPQLALAFPIALIASRSWLIIALSAICTAAFALIATFTFGVAYWERFLEKLAGNIEMLEGWEAMMISAYALGRAWGFDPAGALIIHALLSAITAILLIVAFWRAPRSDASLALLCLALPFLQPRLLYYESGLLIVAFVYLWRSGASSNWLGRATLLFCWSAPPHLLHTFFGLSSGPAYAAVHFAAILYAAHCSIADQNHVVRLRGTRTP